MQQPSSPNFQLPFAADPGSLQPQTQSQPSSGLSGEIPNFEDFPWDAPPPLNLMRFHVIGAPQCQNVALAVFSTERRNLLSCNDSFLDLVEYPLQQVESGFTVADLHRNINTMGPDGLNPRLQEMLYHSAAALVRACEAVANGELPFASLPITFISGTGREKTILLDIVGIQDKENSDGGGQLMWVAREADKPAPRSNSWSGSPPDAKRPSAYPDPPPNFSPPPNSYHLSAVPVPAASPSHMPSPSPVPYPVAAHYPPPSRMPPHFPQPSPIISRSYSHPPPLLPSLLPPSLPDQPLPPSPPASMYRPHPSPPPRPVAPSSSKEPPVRLLMENHSRRKNALKRPWDEKTTKFTLKPP
jgi:hypothetical protein